MTSYNGPKFYLREYFSGYVAGIMNTTSPIAARNSNNIVCLS